MFIKIRVPVYLSKFAQVYRDQYFYLYSRSIIWIRLCNCSGCRTVTSELVTLACFSVCLRRSLVTRVLERGECFCGWLSNTAYTTIKNDHILVLYGYINQTRCGYKERKNGCLAKSCLVKYPSTCPHNVYWNLFICWPARVLQ